VIIGGYRGPRLSISPIQRLLSPRLSNPELIHLVASPLSVTVHGAAARATRSIRTHLANASEIDVIGHSMGGLIGRLLLAEPDLPRIRRLFTFATPHRGAVIANVAAIEPAAWQMRSSSAFLRDLNSRAPDSDVELHFYARLGDWWVGARNCAPPGSECYWLDADSALSKFLGHFSITRDERVLADVLHRLTGLPPLTLATSRPPRN
jgi:pimeloyl-ACP methyl ester carboxylesterase